MQVFDPFTATLAEAKMQPDPYAIHRWGAAQLILAKRAYFERHPIEGVSSCVRHRLVAPDWLAGLFIRQYDKVLNCEVLTWDEAFGDAFGPDHLTPTSEMIALSRHIDVPVRELFSLAWLNVDLVGKTITVPAAPNKGDAPHTIKLNVKALALLKGLHDAELEALKKRRAKAPDGPKKTKSFQVRGLVFTKAQLSTLRLRREYKDRVEELFRPKSDVFDFAPSRIDELLAEATLPSIKLPELSLVKFKVDVREGDAVTFAASGYYLLAPTTQEHVDAGRAYVLDDVSARKVRDRIEAAQASDVQESSVLLRTPAGYQKAAAILGITKKQVSTLLSKTRSNSKPKNERYSSATSKTIATKHGRSHRMGQ